MMADQEMIHLEIGQVIEGWKIEKKLGEGAFGVVYKCSKNGNFYALKVESMTEKIQLLKMEAFVLTELTKQKAAKHFCKIEDKGQTKGMNYVVMTLVGRSLHDLRLVHPERKFSMGTALSVGIQCLEALEELHSIGYLHRDVKPANFTIGRKELDELRKVYVLDFGMARRFVHPDGTIRKPREAAGFRGTLKYAALSSHMNRELCRKDDVESWFYQQVELTKGSLPWRNLLDMMEVGRYKKAVRTDKLTRLLGGCPKQYVDVMRNIDKTKFFDEPDYATIYKLLRESMAATNAEEFPYDWEVTPDDELKPGVKETEAPESDQKTEKNLENK